MLYSAKHPHEGKDQRQVCVEAHHEEVQGRELRGQRNFERNTDLIDTRKLENYTCQVAQDLHSGETQHEPRGAQHCRSPHETSFIVEKLCFCDRPNFDSSAEFFFQKIVHLQHKYVCQLLRKVC